MVNIAIAGGSGQLAREIIDALLSTNAHTITILSRHPPPSPPVYTSPNITELTVDYTSLPSLTSALSSHKTHTVLSFIQPLSDPHGTSQITLINACLGAGVCRFAPSEYASAKTAHLPFWTSKAFVRDYLQNINTLIPVLEYTLFQPGLLMDYLAAPYQTSKHIAPLGTPFDLEHRRAVVVAGHRDAVMVFTSARDVAQAVVRMVEYHEGPWPVVAGMRGGRVTVAEMVGICEAVRGEMEVTEVKAGDLKKGELRLGWGLERRHRAVEDEMGEEMKKGVMVGMLLGCVEGDWDVGGEVNALFPGLEFEGVEGFLRRVWEGKP
ncbi:hypothetical protein QBC34DRAFT_468051 [Podospora aff. communis PSN243]|uniref:NmrA-like domain-containing protein n=1 Tax=Podospora aff. communis PSN243 TaxID=3040156 RepID=A0AAV9H2Q2_9PEZI|nr:hypothetical protein QBC34DRAFT_468051 [Podospora aff. communis PSN243]